MSPATLQVDVIADLICPWSYLGKRRLDDALTRVLGPVLVSWYPFQLNPDMPASGMDFDEYLRAKFGEREMIEPGLQQLAAAGRAVGIDFRFDRIRRVPNTLNAHRLMKLAEEQGADTTGLAESILRAFFTDGLDVSEHDVLLALAARAGLVPKDVDAALEDDLSKQLVLSQEAQVRKGGVSGVPDFLVNKRLFVMGAQSTEILLNVFDRAMFGAESDLEVSPTLH
ncbi:MAG: DsbA family oxidoreductase [Gammaproteobacteria bacterium]|nr:DsbA family oxidoreductase [Gammaproteobacteria bacterium]MDH4253072.1 DsbA family oxidoreductase [Gammaproteobacteria bacterium]MDH5308898.1 DsbA family oxidoreductase [Gammaproteobacteria bacterium]